jgi:succinate dehydrogenase/fumarate reductase flavoprotein subunit
MTTTALTALKTDIIGQVTTDHGVTFQTQVNFLAQSADPTGPIAGAVFYDTDTNKLKVFNGAAWETITSV